jgi:hypothetical protein
MFCRNSPILLNKGDRHRSDGKICYRELMVDHLKNLLRGASSVMDIAPGKRSYQLDRRGFAKDAERLRGDFATVGRGLSKQLKRESTNHRTR